MFSKLSSILGLTAFWPSARVSGTTPKTKAAIWALANSPRCVSGVIATPVENDGDIEIAARFRLQCPTCQSTRLQILCYPKQVTESGVYAGLVPGDTLERNPHHILCVACSSRHLVFDANRHGYDGELGHGSTYEQGEGVESPIECPVDSYGVEVVFVYNIDFEELQQIGKEESLAPQELFDWFHILAISSEGVELRDINYECA